MYLFLNTLISHPIILFFLVANLAIGFWAHLKSRIHSFRDYALASRNLPTAVLVMTLLGTLLDNGYLSLHYGSYRYGLLNFSKAITFCLIGNFIAPRLIYFDGCLTVGDLMSKMYGELSRILSGIISLIFSFVIIGIQLQTISALAKYFFDIPPMYSVMVFGGVIVLYSVFGGMRAVSYTDVLQTFTAIIALTWIVQMSLKEAGGGFLLWKNLELDHKMAFFGLSPSLYRIKTLIFWNFSLVWILNPPIIQRMLVVQDKQVVKKMWYTGATFISFVVFLRILMTMISIQNKGNLSFSIGENSRDLLLHFVKSTFENNIWVADLLFVGLLSFAISTMDSFLHSVGLSFVQDVVNPIRQLTGIPSLNSQQKTFFARLGVFLVGILSLGLGLTNSILVNASLQIYIIHVYAMIIIPLVIGILGLKTDKNSWSSFILAYLSSKIILYNVGWSGNDNFLLSAVVGIVSYFLTHLYVNGGIVTLDRDRNTIGEQLWVPSWKGISEGLVNWFKSTLNLAHLSRIEVTEGRPVQSLAFSIFMFGLYVLASIVIGDGGEGFVEFMVLIRAIGVALCCGLMLEGIWPTYLQPYVPLYWLLTLFYCLPLSGTITFLRMHEGQASFSFFVANFVFLAFLVSSRTFFWMCVWGFTLAHLGWYLIMGALPKDLWMDGTYIAACFVLCFLLIGVLFFVREGEIYASDKLYTSKAIGSAIPHEVRNHLRDVSFVGFINHEVSSNAVPTKNEKGERGFFISEKMRDFMEQGSHQITKSLYDMKAEFKQFEKILDSDIINAPQEVLGIKSLVESTLSALPRSYTEDIQIKVVCEQDFQVRIIRPFFGNVLANFLKNAKKHGAATKLDIRIDGRNLKMYVRDNGNGIPKNVLPRIFDLRFTTGGKENSGVGLALIKLILRASGVNITCQSRQGGKDAFTEFVLDFPLI